MINTENFVVRLQKVMDYYGLSASAFAEKIQFNKSGISHLLSGRNKPSLEFVLKVLDTFPEVSLYWFLNGKGEFPMGTQANPEIPQPEHAPTNTENSGEFGEIERIIIFYKDGSFKSYQPDAQNSSKN